MAFTRTFDGIWHQDLHQNWARFRCLNCICKSRRAQDDSIDAGFHHFLVDNMSTNFEWEFLVKVTCAYAVVSTPFKINVEAMRILRLKSPFHPNQFSFFFFQISFSRCSKKSNSFAIHCLGLIFYVSEFEVYSVFISEF